ncbi:acyl-CoA thioesterase [Alcanivorax hongdengensis]|uniref:acyl-CoA thioesterase n=1 Tax=Alcanivorax hongdengensis TaxID=519051 RepID=UPI00058BFA54|nr:thioesterase family protein [Alcanivorax hongdengensis]
MWTTELRPRFSETDALGHINNTVLPVWFMEAREPVLRLFSPTLGRDGNNALAVVRMEVDFHAETLFGSPVTITTGIGELGNRSFQVIQEAWQNQVLTARGVATLVSFDTRERRSQPLTASLRAQLQAHQVADQKDREEEGAPAGRAGKTP